MLAAIICPLQISTKNTHIFKTLNLFPYTKLIS
jgi:hypothetical protein